MLGKRFSAFLFLLPSLAYAYASNVCPNPWPLRRGLMMYTNRSVATSLLDRIADRFDFANEGYGPDIQYIVSRNPNFRVSVYNSISDNYVPGQGNDVSEHNWLFANAASHGVSGEDVYLHFYEDTVVRLGGMNVTIPGWRPGSPQAGATAQTRDQARVAVYYPEGNRRATNFSTPGVRALHRDYQIMLLNQPIVGSIYPGGIFFDNAAFYPLQVSIVSGGRVAEHPTLAVANSQSFVDWYFLQGEGLFMRELRDYLIANPGVVSNRSVKLMPNVAGVPYLADSRWINGYVTLHPGDVLVQEFQFNPSRGAGMDYPSLIFQNQRQAVQAGISVLETGYVVTSLSGYNGIWTEREALMNTLGIHWVTRSANPAAGAYTYLLGANIWDISDPRWAELNLLGAYDIDLGAPISDPYVIQEGNDPSTYQAGGYPYRVYARRFSCGMAIVRMRGDFDEHIDSTTTVSVNLGESFIPITPDGLSLPATATYNLRNGQAAIFLSNDSVPPDPCLESWVCQDWSTCGEDGMQRRTCIDENLCGSATTRPEIAQSCSATIDPPPGAPPPPPSLQQVASGGCSVPGVGSTALIWLMVTTLGLACRRSGER